MKTRVTGKFVIGFDGRDHVIYKDGEVVYENDKIVFVGHDYRGQVEATISGGEAIVSPGFIDLDALGDIDHAILDTWVPPEITLGLQWSEAYFRTGRHEVFTREEEAFKRRFAFVQLIMNGITTALPIAAETYKEWCETYEEFEDVVGIVTDLGLRAYLGPSYRSGINVIRTDGTWDVLWNEEKGREGLENAAKFVRKYDGANHGLIRGFLAPARIETVTLDLLRESKRYSDELGCPIRLHALQSPNELRLLHTWYQKRPLELLRELGVLGPRTLIPHAILIGGHSRAGYPYTNELETLCQSGTTVIHCPLPTARGGRALESFDRYLRAGVNIGLGTDTFPPDMIRVMDLGSNIGKIVERDQSSSTAANFFRAATLGGARALGRDDLGRLAPNAQADIIIIDLSGLRIGVIDDPIRTMLMNTTGASASTVIVGGRVIMRDGRIPGIDAGDMHLRAQTYFEKYKRSYTERDYLYRPVETLFPPSFPIVERQPKSP